MWKIEKIVSCGKYNYAVVPDHPAAIDHGYVLEHRIIMENILNRLLNPNEIVHHKNGDGKDNRPINLEVMLREKHSRMHTSKQGRKMVILKCPWCNKIFDREMRKSFLQNNTEYTCCSPVCRGKFSRNVQLNGRTLEVEEAISENLVSKYRRYLNDNSEETV